MARIWRLLSGIGYALGDWAADRYQQPMSVDDAARIKAAILARVAADDAALRHHVALYHTGRHVRLRVPQHVAVPGPNASDP
jgi:hypothetical protein